MTTGCGPYTRLVLCVTLVPFNVELQVKVHPLHAVAS